ncbi:MAG TPA: efflux RND transporter periplasmic adaptor subunit [Bacteroidales bacterium]|nr:efflux RND transporter periplasmic adaptor subunit [Bacteroidales bacterium]
MKQILIIVVCLAVGLFLGKLVFTGSGSGLDEHNHGDEEVAAPSVYTCSMHPQIKQDGPGICPICAMDLVPLNTLQSDDEGVDPDEIQMTDAAMALANVETITVRYGDAMRELRLLGKVTADERNIAEITARFGGRIEKLYINYTGQKVRKDQKRATIYSPDLITAQKGLLEAAKYKESNPSFYTAARNKLLLWDLSDEQIDKIESDGKTSNYFDILSPISGIVTGRHIAQGDYVREGSGLLEVIDLTHVWVMFDAYETDLPWIAEGANISFTIPSIPGKTFEGPVTYIDPFINAKTRVARVRVEVNNTDLTLKPEMYANGILQALLNEDQKEIMIPRTAVLWTGKRAVVYVKVPDREMPSFIYREIILGPQAGDNYVVSSGLQEGEVIAVNGVFRIDASAQLAGKTSMMNPGEGSKMAGHSPEMNMATKEHAMIKVYGACSMCKERIETAASELDGVIKAEWDVDAKILHLEYDKNLISPEVVEKAIAAVGHDTEHYRADDQVYESLHSCCHYERPDKESYK